MQELAQWLHLIGAAVSLMGGVTTLLYASAVLYSRHVLHRDPWWFGEEAAREEWEGDVLALLPAEGPAPALDPAAEAAWSLCLDSIRNRATDSDFVDHLKRRLRPLALEESGGVFTLRVGFRTRWDYEWMRAAFFFPIVRHQLEAATREVLGPNGRVGFELPPEEGGSGGWPLGIGN